jgi:hypothetical protein
MWAPAREPERRAQARLGRSERRRARRERAKARLGSGAEAGSRAEARTLESGSAREHRRAGVLAWGASRGERRWRGGTRATQEQEWSPGTEAALEQARACEWSCGCGTWAMKAEQARVRQQEKRSNCARQRRAEQRHAQEECGGKLLRDMRERDGHIDDAAKVFDEMPVRAVLKKARVLLLGEASRVQDAVGRILRRCADAA